LFPALKAVLADVKPGFVLSADSLTFVVQDRIHKILLKDPKTETLYTKIRIGLKIDNPKNDTVAGIENYDNDKFSLLIISDKIEHNDKSSNIQ
jgi:hypothetical protein